MSKPEDTMKSNVYNEIAIEYAEKINASGAREKRERTADPEDLFPDFNRTGFGVYREYERMGNQLVSEDLLCKAGLLGLEFEHLGLTIGSVIHNIDLKKELSESVINLIRQTLLERKVVFFRDQHLTEDDQVKFGRCFGELDAFPFGKTGDNPYILEIVHDERRPGSENGWNTDVTWMENPSLGSIAQCIVAPPFGGDTFFSDSHAAYLGLPASIQERLKFISGTNDYRVFLAGRGGGALRQNLVKELKEHIAFGVDHPILRTHPETKKTALYFHGGFLRHESLYDNRTGETLPAKEAKDIVKFLQQQHAKPEYICQFRWQPGSIAFWDNRAVQHYAASNYYPHKRLVRRVTVSGDRPYYNPEAESGRP